MKKFSKIAVIVLVLLVLAGYGLKVAGDATYYDDYDPDLALNPEAGDIEEVKGPIKVFGVPQESDFLKRDIAFDARPGERVPATITYPGDYEEGDPKLPVIVYLHGNRQDRKFIEKITTPMNKAGFAMASFDQHGVGDRKIPDAGVLDLVRVHMKRPALTVNDGRRLIDYLQTRPEFDPDRIYLVGASYGAITGTVLAAKDKRVKAAVLVVGGGSIPLILNAPKIKDEVPEILSAGTKPLITFFMDVADPIHHAPLVAPTPVLMQNGEDDRVITKQAGEALYAALGEPKQIKWYPIDHPGLRKEDGPEVLRLLDDGLAWLKEQDKPYRMVGEQEDAGELAQAS
jgi:dienelactone hydrolase